MQENGGRGEKGGGRGLSQEGAGREVTEDHTQHGLRTEGERETETRGVSE